MWKTLINKAVRDIRFVLKNTPEQHGAWFPHSNFKWIIYVIKFFFIKAVCRDKAARIKNAKPKYHVFGGWANRSIWNWISFTY